MNNNKLEQIILRLMEASEEKTDRGLSRWLGKTVNYINNCRTNGSISLNMLMDFCEKKQLDFYYIISGIRSDYTVQLKDDEMIIKKSEWETLNIKYQEAREIAMGKKTEKNSSAVASGSGKHGVINH